MSFLFFLPFFFEKGEERAQGVFKEGGGHLKRLVKAPLLFLYFLLPLRDAAFLFKKNFFFFSFLGGGNTSFKGGI